jgi:hypothetical protein
MTFFSPRAQEIVNKILVTLRRFELTGNIEYAIQFMRMFEQLCLEMRRESKLYPACLSKYLNPKGG